MEDKLGNHLSCYIYLQITSMSSSVQLEKILKEPLTTMEVVLNKAISSGRQIITAVYKLLVTPGKKMTFCHIKRSGKISCKHHWILLFGRKYGVPQHSYLISYRYGCKVLKQYCIGT